MKTLSVTHTVALQLTKCTDANQRSLGQAWTSNSGIPGEQQVLLQSS